MQKSPTLGNKPPLRYRVLCTDIDRTFANQERIFPKNIFCLQHLKQKGVTLVANTGRGYLSGYLTRQLNLFDFLIGNDGAVIYNLQDNRLLYHRPISVQNANKIVRLINGYKLPWVAESTSGVYFADTQETRQPQFVRGNGYPYEYVNTLPKAVNRILVMLPPQPTPFERAFQKQFKGDYNVFANKRTFEVTRRHTSKGIALRFLLSKLRVPYTETLVLGDSVADATMLKNTPLSVAMGDGDELAKQAAAFVTDTEANYGWLKGVAHFTNGLKPKKGLTG